MNSQIPKPSAAGGDHNDAPENQIGSFCAYVRRPNPAISGLTAQFYGENGDDADMITALSLTKFQDNNALVNVYFIKDSNGALQKDPLTGAYPLVCSFVGKVQRSKPTRDGMLAQFFAANGDDADQANQLGLTRYQDAFVYVEILSCAPQADSLRSAPADASLRLSAELDQSAKTLTPAERKAAEKRAKIQREAHKLLQLSGFFLQPQVWAVLGSHFDFENWIAASPCCAPGQSPCANPAQAFALPADLAAHTKYVHVPLCAEHQAQALAGALPGGAALLKMRRQALVGQWAIEQLAKTVGLDPATSELDPQKVMAWAFENKLSSIVPPNYVARC